SPKNVDEAGASGGSARSREANHSLASFTGYFSLRTRRNSRRSRVALDRRSSGQLRRSASRVVSLTTCGESQVASGSTWKCRRIQSGKSAAKRGAQVGAGREAASG